MASEKRLIDADEIEELFYKQLKYGATDLVAAFDDALHDSKVPLVRCKDCQYNDCGDCVHPKNIAYYSDQEGYSIPCYLGVDDEHYCSYGERKDNG